MRERKMGNIREKSSVAIQKGSLLSPCHMIYTTESLAMCTQHNAVI